MRGSLSRVFAKGNRIFSQNIVARENQGKYPSLSRWFSAASLDSSTVSSQRIPLRRLVRPFLQKCHPDVQKDDTAKQVNLLAVQNLNSYIDTVQNLCKVGSKLRKPSSTNVNVDFMISSTEPRGKKKFRDIHLRKRVSLRLPPPSMINALHLSTGTADREISSIQLENFAVAELSKLLRVAGLEIPDHGYNEPFADTFTAEDGDLQRRPQNQSSRYQQSRARFVSRIDWKKYKQVYNQAIQDMKDDLATHQLLRNNPKLRREHLAHILSRIQVHDPMITITEQAIAFRRLALLLDQHFDDLKLDDWGRLWETVTLILVPGTDFVFKVDDNDEITFQIPIDLENDERLVKELENGIIEYSDWLRDGQEDIFVDTKHQYIF